MGVLTASQEMVERDGEVHCKRTYILSTIFENSGICSPYYRAHCICWNDLTCTVKALQIIPHLWTHIYHTNHCLCRSTADARENIITCKERVQYTNRLALYKHTSPYGTPLIFPLALSTEYTASAACNVSLAPTLLATQHLPLLTCSLEAVCVCDKRTTNQLVD